MAKCENMSFTIVIIYRLPSYSKAEFCDDLQQFLEDIEDNIDWLSDFYKSLWESILNDIGLKQIMKEVLK